MEINEIKMSFRERIHRLKKQGINKITIRNKIIPKMHLSVEHMFYEMFASPELCFYLHTQVK